MEQSRLSRFGAAVGDSNRAAMLSLLQSGRAYTAGELARGCGLAPSTASSHLAKLVDAGLVVVVPAGRHRYFQISSEEVAEILEAIDGAALTQVDEPRRPKTGSAMAYARSCYDHLAGEIGVNLLTGMVQRDLVITDAQPALTAKGSACLNDLGIDVDTLTNGRRILVRVCLDWTERRNHLGGAVGAALLDQFLARKWVRHGYDHRVLEVTKKGRQGFEEHFGFLPRVAA